MCLYCHSSGTLYPVQTNDSGDWDVMSQHHQDFILKFLTFLESSFTTMLTLDYKLCNYVL